MQTRPDLTRPNESSLSLIHGRAGWQEVNIWRCISGDNTNITFCAPCNPSWSWQASLIITRVILSAIQSIRRHSSLVTQVIHVHRKWEGQASPSQEVMAVCFSKSLNSSARLMTTWRLTTEQSLFFYHASLSCGWGKKFVTVLDVCS